MQIEAFILSVGTYCTGLGQLNNNVIMLFSKVSKVVVGISNTSLSKNYVVHLITVVCVID